MQMKESQKIVRNADPLMLLSSVIMVLLHARQHTGVKIVLSRLSISNVFDFNIH
jgi:hypothetical protein